MPEPFELTASEALMAMRQGALSPVELVQALLQRIEALEPAVQAWEHLDAEGALAEARRRERQLRQGDELGPLHGVPLGVKDIYHVAGMPTGAGFRPFKEAIATEDAVSVARLRAAGAVILGKAVTTQFALSDPARTRNPWNTARTPGGSSAGSAAAVAARMVPGALGTQTAGSVLRPAAYCGVVGFKPTYGRVSRRGVLPLSWSLDHVGLIVRSVADAALLLQALAGHDPLDPGSAAEPVEDYAAAIASPRPPRLGLMEELVERATPAVREHVRQAAGRLAQAGATIEPVRCPEPFELVVAAHHLIMQVEAAAVHRDLHARHPDDYQPLLRALIEVGQTVPGPDYVQARRLQRRLRTQFAEALAGFDGWLSPTASNVAPDPSTTGDKSFQVPWSMVGFPSISLPSGLSEEGLPLAIQLASLPFSEGRLLAIARWCEEVLGRLPLAAEG